MGRGTYPGAQNGNRLFHFWPKAVKENARYKKKNTENRDLTKIEAGEAEIWCTSAVLHGETENIDETMLTRKKNEKKNERTSAAARSSFRSSLPLTQEKSWGLGSM